MNALSPASSAAVEAAAAAAMAAAGASSSFAPPAMGPTSTLMTAGQSFAPHAQRPHSSASQMSAAMVSPRQGGGGAWGAGAARAGGSGPPRSMQQASMHMHQRSSLRGMGPMTSAAAPAIHSASSASNGAQLQQTWSRERGGACAGRPTRDGTHGMLGHAMVASRAPPSSQVQVRFTLLSFRTLFSLCTDVCFHELSRSGASGTRLAGGEVGCC